MPLCNLGPKGRDERAHEALPSGNSCSGATRVLSDGHCFVCCCLDEVCAPGSDTAFSPSFVCSSGLRLLCRAHMCCASTQWYQVQSAFGPCFCLETCRTTSGHSSVVERLLNTQKVVGSIPADHTVLFAHTWQLLNACLHSKLCMGTRSPFRYARFYEVLCAS